MYAIVKQKKIYYIGFSSNLNQRWRGKGHHRFLQADRLGYSSLHYLPLPKQRAKEFEKLLIAEYDPPWNYSKVPVLHKVSWIRRLAAAAACLLVLFISSRSLVLGMVAAIVAAAMFQ